MRKPDDPAERKPIEDIEEYGWHVLKVMEDSAVDPWVRDNQPVIEDQGDPPWAPLRTT